MRFSSGARRVVNDPPSRSLRSRVDCAPAVTTRIIRTALHGASKCQTRARVPVAATAR